jgi:hypothetical protein
MSDSNISQMKRNVIVCGLISGGILVAVMVGTTTVCYNNEDFKGNMVVGYTAMILAFSLIFAGIKSFRDRYNQGSVTFGKAFTIGLYISLIASSLYVAVWLVDYYIFIPDFMDKYSAYMIRQTRAEGGNAAEIRAKAVEMEEFKELYKNPLFVVLITYAEVLPVGLLVSLICALILKRKTA